MGIQTKYGGDNLPAWLSAAVENLIGNLDHSQYSELYRLASNARQRIMGSSKEWQPFESLLLDNKLDRSNRNHVTAIVLALMPRVLKQEKLARFAAVNESRKRMAAAGVQVQWGPSGKFVVSNSTSTAIDKGAKRLASSLDRLAKN
jgi:hypothetical protein